MKIIENMHIFNKLPIFNGKLCYTASIFLVVAGDDVIECFHSIYLTVSASKQPRGTIFQNGFLGGSKFPQK